jgi:hypothetical protein
VKSPISRGEHQSHVDLVADRLAYLVVSYDLLAVVAYRGFNGAGPTWDLLGLVILGGIVGMAYRLARGVLAGRWVALVLITILIGIVVGAVLALTE